jgi:hypothetical protein
VRYTLPQPVIDLSNPQFEEVHTNGELTSVSLNGPGFHLSAGRRTTGQWKVNGWVGGMRSPRGVQGVVEDIRYYENEAPSKDDLIWQVKYTAEKMGYKPE